MNKEIEDKNLFDHINKSEQSEMSSNFTHQVMSKVEHLEIKKSITDKPLVGLVGWLMFILFGGLIITAFIIAYQTEEFTLSLPKIDYSKIAPHMNIVLATIFSVAALIVIDKFLRKPKNG